jgi:alkanesulfonate monooxygenase SsuD/methylene tetrahydromethanopterin reductase-like flavin-dependent oxidoreductase (luciferase family)
MRLGTAVMVLPWHNPALLAEQAAAVDVLSNGRLDLGVGRGYRYSEFSGFRMSYGRSRIPLSGMSRLHQESLDRQRPVLA